MHNALITRFHSFNFELIAERFADEGIVQQMLMPLCQVLWHHFRIPGNQVDAEIQFIIWMFEKSSVTWIIKNDQQY